MSQSTYLRRVLYGNAVFSGISGLVCIAASGLVAAFLGLDAAPVILGLGAGLAAYAALLSFQASRPVISRPFVLFAVGADVAWVLLSILLLTTHWIPFAPEGKWATGIVAAIVEVFATLQFMAWRKM